MSHLMIRKIIRNILLETRGPLGIIPVLKEWVKVAAEYGKLENPHVTGPGGNVGAEHAALRVPHSEAHRVFAALTPDLKEWVLKHWRSEEYFSAMISGVIFGLIRAYEQPNYAGMKSGTTHIRGAINREGKMTARMSGYLTAKSNDRRTNWKKGYRDWMNYIYESNGELNKEGWIKEMNSGIADTESTLVHEFQHWFQESIYYAENMKKIPTKRKGKSYALPDAKERLRNIKPLKPIHLMLAKRGFSGVDWNTTMKVRGATAYKLSDPEAFFDSYNPLKLKGLYAGEAMITQALSKIQSKGAMKALIEEILYDFLKLQNIITSEDIDEIADEAMQGGWNPIRIKTQSLMWKKYNIPIQTQIDGEEAHDQSQRKWRGDSFNPLRDTPKGSGETTVQGTDSLLKSLSQNFNVFILRSTDFDKNGKLKPGREPLKPTEARARKATWVVLGRGLQSLPRRSAGSYEGKFMDQRGTSAEKGFRASRWTDRWVEFDAVATEYTVSVVRWELEHSSDPDHVWLLVRGEDEEFSKQISKRVIRKVRNRGFNHVNMRVNVEHIESMTERITDRLIETIEQNPYEDWLASSKSPKPPWSPTNARPASVQQFDEWAGKDRSSSRPFGTTDYFDWIFAKASGEDV